jgi:hypothetical protein
MHHLDSGNSGLGQVVPRVTELSTPLPFTPHPLTERSAAQSITGGRFEARVALLGQPREEAPHLRLSGCHLLLHLHDLARLRSMLCF